MTEPLARQSSNETQRELEQLYRDRFSERELASKQALWRVLCDQVFQELVPETGTVVDLGAGNCEFVNSITAARRIAVDLNPDTVKFAGSGVEVLTTSASEMSMIDDGAVDTVFTSNFFEHLPSKVVLLDVLRECHRVTKPGGRMVVLMPNVRYLAGRYWDYFDHHLPLTHHSLAEGVTMAGFSVDRSIPRFVPYTVKDSPLKVRGRLVRLYLRLPVLWPLLGRQMFLAAHKP